ncbi:hypothetical protein [Paraburkholderia sp. DHOC27]|uniref:hypothetical protein n=1 Tax=Paraburkholderia sp. DHOC27 TaxID=2303330 RepID=UPI000E3D29E3|nr:hypothetical protein [Paraburkholderia sp. DHOC27]RFU49088.1 hypothetical protein D0B32_04550 [Paraburkholderia sp. DHOC27]
MTDSPMESYRKDEWSELLLLVMKTALAVAHELGLPPDGTLDCAARRLHFHDFAWFASAMQGASRAYACCERSTNISAVEVAYINTLAAHLKNNRNVLSSVPTLSASARRSQVEAPATAFEKVAKALAALKDDIQREFSQSSSSGSSAPRDASGFARALVAIMGGGANNDAYGRALAAVLRVRFAVDGDVAAENVDITGSRPGYDAHVMHEPPLVSRDGWTQRVKDAIRHPNVLHK